MGEKTCDAQRKVYVTERALERGIVLCEFIEMHGTFAKVVWPGMPSGWNLIARYDFHDTIEQAQARVRRMVKAKVNKMDEERARLEAIAKCGAKVTEPPPGA